MRVHSPKSGAHMATKGASQLTPTARPAMTAMTAMTIDKLSGGRFMLGLGPSGPQVVEGWHGVEYGRPLTRTREYVSIVRKIMAREARLEHKGYHYEIPFMSEGATGHGKPLKSILHGDPALRIFTAAISPKGLACAAEVADGVFPIWMNPERFDLFEQNFEQGFGRAAGGKKRLWRKSLPQPFEGGPGARR